MQTAIQQMIDFINDINDNDSTNFNYYYDSIITKLNELLEVEKQQISGAPELRYKDDTPMRKYNSPKLQELEQINQDNPMTRGSTALVYKQETLEEAALRLFPKFISDPYNPSEDLNKEERNIWIEGAKWQQETSSQTEISDDEIDKIAKEYVLYNESKRNWVVEGMKLYREQLKKK